MLRSTILFRDVSMGSIPVLVVFLGKQQQQLLLLLPPPPPIPKTTCAQIPGVRSTGRQRFVWWCLIFVPPHCGTFFMSTFWRLFFLLGSWISGKFLYLWLRLYISGRYMNDGAYTIGGWQWRGKYSEKKLYQCHCVDHKSHLVRPQAPLMPSS